MKEHQYTCSLENISPTTMAMYIDDGNIWVSSSSLNTNVQILQAAYKTVNKQLANSGLSIDTNKCELIHFTRRKRDRNEKPSIKIPNTQGTNTTTIAPAPHIKWLGITFDSNLNFHEHVRITAIKAENALGGLYMLGNTLKGLSAHHFRLLYTQTIRPIINYAAPTWAAGTKSQIKPLIKVQNKALRLICAAFRTSPIHALEIEAAIPPLDIHLETVKRNAAIRLSKIPLLSPITQRLPNKWRNYSPPSIPPPIPTNINPRPNAPKTTSLLKLATQHDHNCERISTIVRATLLT
jgi:hypothetical protein